ncbi:DUF4091 domain-containing protein [Paenibacillus cymbidii]|uniref:DUF4091 domain-containing protein n=1 Tax=Paenibacillus cymbidii TaxID=1639034 RepID=UPI0010800851|nr:DUF4091 domain-containing protein [Paenibacillus cymbidii]
MNIGLQAMSYKAIRGNNSWTEGEEAARVSHLELAACRRDSAAFQIVLSDRTEFVLSTGQDPQLWKKGPANMVRVEAKLNESLPGLTLQINLVGFTKDDDGREKADLLLDQTALYVPERMVQPVWVEFTAAANAAPGRYTGTVRVYAHTLFEDETLLKVLTFALEVKHHTLPEPGDYRFYLDLWQHSSNIARKYDVALWTDEHFRILDAYLASLGQLGQKAATVIVSECPWSGQFTHRDREPSDLFEYSIVGVVKSKEGGFAYDFDALDRYIELAEKHGIREEIEVFGLLNIWQDPVAGYGAIVEGSPDGVRVRYYDEADAAYKFIRSQEDLTAYVSALERHFVERGWIDRVRIIADEPSDTVLFARRLEALRDMAPKFKYKVAINHVEFIREQVEGMYDYVPILTGAASEHERLEELRPTIAGKLLYYVCCHPDRPNTFIDSPALESRLIAWLAERLGFDGFLRWNYTVWPDDPLRTVSYRSPHWKAGDTNFVYPGRTGKPLLSLRYKWLQRGIRDFEIMQQLKDEGKAELVKASLNRVFEGRSTAELTGLLKESQTAYSLQADDYDGLLAHVN